MSSPLAKLPKSPHPKVSALHNLFLPFHNINDNHTTANVAATQTIIIMTPYATPPRSHDGRGYYDLTQDVSSFPESPPQHLPLTPQSIQNCTPRPYRSAYTIPTPSPPQYVSPYKVPATTSSVGAPKPVEPTQAVKTASLTATPVVETPWSAIMASFVRSLPARAPYYPFESVPVFDETTTKVRKLVEKKMIVADKDADGKAIKVEIFYLGLEDAQKYARYLAYNRLDFAFATPTKTYTVDFKIWSRKFPHGSTTGKTLAWNYEIGICGQLRHTSMSDLLKRIRLPQEEDPSWENAVVTLRRTFGIIHRAAPLQPNQHVFVKSSPPKTRKSRAPKPAYLPPPPAPRAPHPMLSLNTYLAALQKEAASQKSKAEESIGPASKRPQYQH
ncbi:hypothetical protein DL98DRAFT_571383 [Cadophora sp. DSE1049]|nr:hypothetical protein DL98DRAFT_571383 [Cadophora sp. DSE1049]